MKKVCLLSVDWSCHFHEDMTGQKDSPAQYHNHWYCDQCEFCHEVADESQVATCPLCRARFVKKADGACPWCL